MIGIDFKIDWKPTKKTSRPPFICISCLIIQTMSGIIWPNQGKVLFIFPPFFPTKILKNTQFVRSNFLCFTFPKFQAIRNMCGPKTFFCSRLILSYQNLKKYSFFEVQIAMFYIPQIPSNPQYVRSQKPFPFNKILNLFVLFFLFFITWQLNNIILFFFNQL